MTATVPPRLAIVLSTHAEPTNLDAALGLAGAALARGVTCYLYLIDDGVHALADARVRALARRGMHLFACAYGCRRRSIPLEDCPDVTYCGLVVLADLLTATDRVVALN